MTQTFEPAAFAQRQLDAYSARDLERFVREYTDDVQVVRLLGEEIAPLRTRFLAAGAFEFPVALKCGNLARRALGATAA
mgnify:CR=1 FL=1